MEAVERSRARRARVAGCTAAMVAVVGLGISVAANAPIAGARQLCMGGEASVPITADAKVSSVHPRRHYGRRDTWKVKYGPATTRSFITFDLPTPPIECTVDKATLELRGRYSGRPSSPTEYPGAEVDMSLIRRGWSERKITWNNKPRGNGCDVRTSEYALSRKWLITGMVQKAYQCLDDGRLASFEGFKLKGWSPGGRGAHWQLGVDSRESSHPPVVHIAWG
jgi:hypothetical protein